MHSNNVTKRYVQSLMSETSYPLYTLSPLLELHALCFARFFSGNSRSDARVFIYLISSWTAVEVAILRLQQRRGGSIWRSVRSDT